MRMRGLPAAIRYRRKPGGAHHRGAARVRPYAPTAPQPDQPPAVPTGDGLDDVRAALEGPIRAWLAMQADQAPSGGARELAEVTA